MRLFKIAPILALVPVLLLKSDVVFAASMYLEAQGVGMRAGEARVINVLLDTENEEVNALEGALVFPPESFEIQEIRDGSSSVMFWVVRPRVTGDKIVFSGIIPGGLQEDKSLLFSVVAKPLHGGSASFGIQDPKILLNDGNGTAASVQTRSLAFDIEEAASGQGLVMPRNEDRDPPEAFVPIVSRDENIFEGKRFLVFATQDKGAGMDHYEVREGKSGFVVAESPYLLQNQTADRDISVKAVDKAGNERVATIDIGTKKKPYQKYAALAILLLIAFAIGGLFFRRKQGA